MSTSHDAPLRRLLGNTAAPNSSSGLFESVVDDNANMLFAGLVVGFGTVLLTAALELFSMDAARSVQRQPGGAALYRTAVLRNIFNNLVIGPVVYWAGVTHFCRARLEPRASAIATVILLLVQSVGYYLAHASMHIPALYCFHKLHHRFNTNVCPVAANCVSLAEYAIAYMLPIVLGIVVAAPDRLALVRAVNVISVLNLLIHTPRLAAFSERYLPWFLVGTHDHLEHHKRLTTLYAAPTLCVDRIVERALALGRRKAD